MMGKKSVLIIAYVLFLWACSDSEKKRFDQTTLLTNLTENIIVPSYVNHNANVMVLKSKAEKFSAALTIENLQAVKSAWFIAKSSWKTTEIFNFGPVDDLGIETRMDLWPTSTNGIETAIINYSGSDSYLDAIGSNKKGLPAIEYLLFHADESTVLDEFSNDENRVQYLKLLTIDLVDQMAEILDVWQGGYAEEFIHKTGNSSEASAVLVANQMLFLLKDVKNYKLGTPFGSGSLEGPQPDEVESLFAGKSLEFIADNISAIETVYLGGAGIGFDDYLDFAPRTTDANEPLSQVIRLQIMKCETSLTAITVPLEQAVVSQQPQVEQLITDLNVLNAYMETDMMQRLNLVITFTDNDGD